VKIKQTSEIRASIVSGIQAVQPGARTIAVMQPYFFPYIGYFQLMAATDLFIFLDDVQYIKGGWMNRNRVLRNGDPVWLTLPLTDEGHEQFICEKRLHHPEKNLPKIFNRIREYYRPAPFFRETSELLAPLFLEPAETIAEFNVGSLRAIAKAIGISLHFVLASARNYGHDLSREARLIRICASEGATHYVNPIGAREIGLYSAAHFRAAGLSISYLKTSPELVYEQKLKQTLVPFVPYLSIVDVLMFVRPDRICELLAMYSLEEG
jgi:hypothetical protein